MRPIPLRGRAPSFLYCLAFSIWVSVSARADLSLLTQISSPAASGSLVWGDADRDDDLDLWISGSRFETSSFRSSVLRNDRNGVLSASLAELTQLNRGEAAWVDFDRDGDLDALITGNTSSSSASSAVHRNDLPTGFTTVVNINRLPNLGDSALACGDADGDGDPDVLICGASTASRQAALYWDFDGDLDLLGGVNSIVGVYSNPGTGEYPNAATASTSLRCRALRWGDFDNDSDFDVIVSNTGTTLLSGQTRLYLNPIRNTQPAPPATMTQAVSGNSVVLNWPALAPIGGAPVTYNVRVGTAPGLGNVLSPHSRADGRRLLPAPGNAGFANSRTLRQLPAGTYWWTVQAIDHRWHGQPWLAEQSFTISSPLVPRITSLELINALQARLKFDAPAGRVVSVEASTNLSAWTERTTVSVGLSGSAEAVVPITGDGTFFRLLSPNYGVFQWLGKTA